MQSPMSHTEREGYDADRFAQGPSKSRTLTDAYSRKSGRYKAPMVQPSVRTAVIAAARENRSLSSSMTPSRMAMCRVLVTAVGISRRCAAARGISWEAPALTAAGVALLLCTQLP